MPTSLSSLFSIVASLLLICAASHAKAEERVRMTLVPVAVLAAHANESEQEFLLRTGRVLQGFTRMTGFEACSPLCRAVDGRLGVSLYTSQSHIGCLVVNVCPLDMVQTGETIHSHTNKTIFDETPADRMFGTFRPGRSTATPKSPGRSVFSLVDYQSGPGYVVDGAILWKQEGPGTDHKIGVIR